MTSRVPFVQWYTQDSIVYSSMFTKRITILNLSEWDMDTLCEVSKEKKSSNARDTIRTSTRLPDANFENMHHEEPDVIEVTSVYKTDFKGSITNARNLRNSGGGRDNISE